MNNNVKDELYTAIKNDIIDFMSSKLLYNKDDKKQNSVISNIADDTYSSIKDHILYFLQDKQFNLVDMLGNKYTLPITDVEMATEAANRLFSGKYTELENVFADDKFLILNDCIFYGLNKNVAHYIQKYSPSFKLALMATGDILSTDFILNVDTYKKYIDTCCRIDSSKYLLEIDNDADVLHDIKNVSHIISNYTPKQLHKIIQNIDVHKVYEINKLASKNHISSLDLAYRLLKNNWNIDEAVQQGLDDKEKYNIEYHGCLQVNIDTYLYKADKIVEKIILEKLRAKGELVD